MSEERTAFDEGFRIVCPNCKKDFEVFGNLETDVGGCPSDPGGPTEITCPHCKCSQDSEGRCWNPTTGVSSYRGEIQ